MTTNDNDRKAQECVDAFKPLADLAMAILLRPRLVTEFWVVAKQNPGASPKCCLLKHTTSPTALEWCERPQLEGSGWGFEIFEDEAGATRRACSFSYHLNRCQGIDFYIPVRVFLDGASWCAVHPDFVNLAESPAGFGMTIEEAVDDLDIPAHKGGGT